jgi:hypothetical protein
MFIRLFVDRTDPKSLIVINVDTIRFISPIQVDGASHKCVLWFAQDHSVTVDHEFDFVMSLLNPITPIPKPPARPKPPEVISDLLYSNTQRDERC